MALDHSFIELAIVAAKSKAPSFFGTNSTGVPYWESMVKCSHA